MGEMNYYGVDLSKTAVVERTVNIDNVLDLTDPSVQKELGVSPSQLTVDDYSVTQSLGSWASSKYNAILVPAARAPGTSNLVILDTSAPY